MVPAKYNYFGRLVIIALVPGSLRRFRAEIPLIRAVQNSGATFELHGHLISTMRFQVKTVRLIGIKKADLKPPWFE